MPGDNYTGEWMPYMDETSPNSNSPSATVSRIISSITASSAPATSKNVTAGSKSDAVTSIHKLPEKNQKNITSAYNAWKSGIISKELFEENLKLNSKGLSSEDVLFIESNNEAEYSLAYSLFIDVDDAVKYAAVGMNDSANKSGFDGKIRFTDETGYEHIYDPTNVFNRLKDGGAIIFGVDSTVNKGDYLATIFQHMFNVINQKEKYYSEWLTVKGYAGEHSKQALINYAASKDITGYMRGDNPAFGATLFSSMEYEYNIQLGMSDFAAQSIFDLRRDKLGLERVDMSEKLSKSKWINTITNPVLGNDVYEYYIQRLVDVNGANYAFNQIMTDVDKYGSQLDDFSSKNVANLNSMVASLVEKIGYVNEEMHFFRNKLNRAPSSLDEMYKLNQGKSESQQWRLLDPALAGYHMNGEGGVFNVKFVSPDGHFEAVYNKNGELLTEANDPVNMGTYNYFGPDNAGAHTTYDVTPYITWGNARGTPSRGNYEHAHAVENTAKFWSNIDASNHYYDVLKKANPESYQRMIDYYESR